MRRDILTARDRRALTIGAAAIIALVAGVRGFPAWRAWRAEARAAAAEKMTEAAKKEAILERFEESLDSLEARMARVRDVGTSLVVAETPGEAVSSLTAALAETARISSVRLDAVAGRVDSSTHRALSLVSVDAQATGDITGLASLLYRLERNSRFVAIRRLVIRPENVAGPSDQVETLGIRLTVQGLALVRAGEQTR